MTVDIFTKQEFEDALPIHKETGDPLWIEVEPSFRPFEYQYYITIDDKTGIMIRSSIRVGKTTSDKTGKNSIRAWLVQKTEQGYRPLGHSKSQSYVTRVSGWQKRLTDVLRTLWGLRRTAGDCNVCKEPKSIWKCKKENENKGRMFANCKRCEGEGFEWIT